MHSSDVKNYVKKLVQWYKKHHRTLPWRNTKDPYFIWLSEIILQQTTVKQGLDYYVKFVKKYPSIHALARVSLEEVLKDWQGLGYYSRARNLHATAQHIVSDLNGVFPKTYHDLLKLKGVGKYTAAAIASFAFNQSHPVIDGNVLRVFSRLYNIDAFIDKPIGRKLIEDLINHWISYARPELFNQAIMEFGALQCVPKNPDCTNCIFQDSCLAFKFGKVTMLPLKSPKKKKKKRFFHFVVTFDINNHTLIEQRQTDDIWKGLYSFPLIERNNSTPISDFKKVLPYNFDELIQVSSVYKQELTHQSLHSRFYIVAYNGVFEPHSVGYEKILIKNLQDKPWPRTIDLYLSDLSIPLN